MLINRVAHPHATLILILKSLPKFCVCVCVCIYMYICFGQEPTPDIRNNIYFRRFGLAAFFGDTLVTIVLSQVVCTCVYYIVADWLILNTLDAKAMVNARIT